MTTRGKAKTDAQFADENVQSCAFKTFRRRWCGRLRGSWWSLRLKLIHQLLTIYMQNYPVVWKHNIIIIHSVCSIFGFLTGFPMKTGCQRIKRENYPGDIETEVRLIDQFFRYFPSHHNETISRLYSAALHCTLIFL